MNAGDSPKRDELAAALYAVRRRMRLLSAAVLLMMLALGLDVIAVFGRGVDFDGSEGLARGSLAAGAALLGFALGWGIAALVGAVFRRGAARPAAGNRRQEADPALAIQALGRRVRLLSVAVLLMTLGLLLNLSAVFGSIVAYHADEELLRIASAVGVAVLGALFGWIACRRA